MSGKSKTDPRFEKFWEVLSQREEIDIPEELKKVLFDCLDMAGFNQPASKKKTAAPKETGVKRVSGWNLFMTEKMPEIKADSEIEPSARMSKIAEMWAELGDDGRAEWCEEHGVPCPKPKTTSKKAPSRAKKSEEDEEEAPAKTQTPAKKTVKKPAIEEEEEEEEAPAKSKIPAKKTIKKPVIVDEAKTPGKKVVKKPVIEEEEDDE